MQMGKDGQQISHKFVFNTDFFLKVGTIYKDDDKFTTTKSDDRTTI